MPWLTDLADACRASGLPVHEVPGWRTRGHGPMGAVRGATCHWTATGAGVRPAEDYPSLGIVRDGRPDLRGLLSPLGLGRSGTVYVIGAGLAYHAGPGYWPGVGSNGNANSIGIECEGAGAWTAAQLEAYPRLCAALARHYGFPVARVHGHHEWAPGRKIDIHTWPGGMAAFRATVQQRLSNPNPVQEDDDMVRFVRGDLMPHVFKVEWSHDGPQTAVRTWVPAGTDPGFVVAQATGAQVHVVRQSVIDAIPYKEGTRTP